MSRRALGFVMLGVTVLFALRVAGQAVVARFSPPFLPSMKHWQSGLLPYPVLLAAQTAILGLLVALTVGLLSGRAWATLQRPRLGAVAVPLGLLYFGAMVVRYVVTRFDDTIPVVMHSVLATGIVAFGRYHRGSAAGARLLPVRATR